jgi:hypothetical protein
MHEQGIAAKLEANADAIRMVRRGGPVGRAAAAGLAARCGLEVTAPLRQQLAAGAVLAGDEAAYLDGESSPPSRW